MFVDFNGKRGNVKFTKAELYAGVSALVLMFGSLATHVAFTYINLGVCTQRLDDVNKRIKKLESIVYFPDMPGNKPSQPVGVPKEPSKMKKNYDRDYVAPDLTRRVSK